MRILLIATNRHDRLMSGVEARPLPIGLAYVAGYLDPNRHDLKVLDLMFSTDPLAETAQTVREYRPDLVGLSIRNLDNQSYLDPQWALPFSRDIIQCVRANTQAPIVCGGPAFSALPAECFEFLGPDLGIVGDAGGAFSRLADLIDDGLPYRDLPGLVYREDGRIVLREQGAPPDFQKPPRLEELDISAYEQPGFGIGILTKLAGSYYPTTPDSKGTEEGGWRVIRPVEEVVQEVRDLKARFGIRRAFFIDSAFNIPLAGAKSLCHSLIDADLDLQWNTYLAAVPQSCDRELVELMVRSGCNLVLLAAAGGGSDAFADLGGRLQDAAQVCRLCEETGLEYMISESFGEPGETRETVERKLEFLRDLRPAVANLRVGVRVLPGTPTAQAAFREGLIADESELIRPTFFIADTVKGWIVDRLKVEASKNPRWNLL